MTLTPPVRHLFLLGIILAAAAALRIHRLHGPSFGIDELFSTHFALSIGPWESALPGGTWLDPPPNIQSISHAGPLSNLKHSLSRDTHPPLYPLLLRGWMHLFGDGDTAERALSVVLSLLAILLLFDAVRMLHGRAAGLWAASLMAVAGPQIEFAQEVRGYMPLVTLTCAAAALAARIVAIGPSIARLILLGLVALAAMLTHYWAVAPLLAVTLFLLMQLRRRRLALLAALAAAALVFVSLWGDVLLAQRPFFEQNMRWIGDDSPGHAARTFRAAAAAPIRLLFHPGNRLLDGLIDGSNPAWMAIGLVFLLPLLGWRANRGLRLWWLMLVLPMALVVAADLTQARKTIVLVRYVLPASVGLFGLVAGSLAHLSDWRARVLPALTLIACLVALPRAWDRDKPDFRAFARDFTGGLTPEDRLILLRDPDSAWQSAITYMAVARYARPIRSPLLVLDEPLNPSQHQALKSEGRCFVISPIIPLPLDRYFHDYQVVRQSGVPFAGGWAEIRSR